MQACFIASDTESQLIGGVGIAEFDESFLFEGAVRYRWIPVHITRVLIVDYLKPLVDEIHSATVATTGLDGHPQTRIIDIEKRKHVLVIAGKIQYNKQHKKVSYLHGRSSGCETFWR